MDADILYQFAMAMVIIAFLMLILVLWRLYLVLTDVNDMTKVIQKRTREVDGLIDNFQSTVKNYKEIVLAFLESFNNIKKIKEKIGDFWAEREASASEESESRSESKEK